MSNDEYDTAALSTAYRRLTQRWACEHQVELVRTSGSLHPRWAAVVVDASAGGVGLVCRPVDGLGPGTELVVRCVDGNWAAGRVRHCTETPTGLRLGVTVTRASGQLSSLFPPDPAA